MRDLQGAYRPARRRGANSKSWLPTLLPNRHYRSWLAKCHGLLIEILVTQGRFAEAEAKAHLAIALGEQLEVDFPDVPEYREQLGAAPWQSGECLRSSGQVDCGGGGTPPRRAGLRATGRTPPGDALLPVSARVVASQRRSRAVNTLGDYPGAEPEIRRAVSLARKLTADHPDVPDYRDRLALCHRHLGGLLRTTGKLADAEPELRQALALEKTRSRRVPGRPQKPR